MFSMNFSQFEKLSHKGNLIPLYAEIAADLDTPVSAFLKIREGQNDFLFESVAGGNHWGRYSFLGTNPIALIRSKGFDVEIVRGKHVQKINAHKDPLVEIKKYMSQFKPVAVAGLPRFFGGAVGYLAYDMVRFFEDLPQTARDDLDLYDSFFMITDTIVLFDNLRQVIQVVANIHLDGKKTRQAYFDEAKKNIRQIIGKLKKPIPHTKKTAVATGRLKPVHDEKKFCEWVEKIRKFIVAGDVFQTVISTRFEARTNIEPFELYRSIRRLNPSPYLYYLKLADLDIVGSSPEVMVRLEDQKVELRPIAGTRRRGRNDADDLRMQNELLSDPKEMAEHMMLVDLGRNDIGRVSQIPTVKVDELGVLEKYSHVMHIVSHVSGKLKKGKDAYDVLRAVFPAGTLSGAPKIRAMEIIEELEGVKRGLYGGCVGYISFTGNMDTAITIRTALFKDKKIYIQAGAGIVYNSIPEREYLECQNKVMGMMKALASLG